MYAVGENEISRAGSATSDAAHCEDSAMVQSNFIVPKQHIFRIGRRSKGENRRLGDFAQRAVARTETILLPSHGAELAAYIRSSRRDGPAIATNL